MSVLVQIVAQANGVATSSKVATFTGISMGSPPLSGVRVLAYCCFSRDITPISATFDSGSGDVAMSMTAVATVGPPVSAVIFYRNVTESGFTGTLKVTFDGDDTDGTSHGINGFSIADTVLSSFQSGINTTTNFGSTPLTTGSISISGTGGFLGCMTCDVATSGVTWTSDNGFESTDANYNNNFRFSSMSGNGSQSGPITVTNSFLGDAALAWISFDIAGIQQAGARFAGAGSLQPSWIIPGVQFAATRFNGRGSLQPRVTGKLVAGARFSGAGNLRGNGVANLHIDSWPITLPQCPILNGFSEQRQNNILEFASDVASPKLRRRSSQSSMLTNVIFRMTTTDLNTFNAWYIDTIQDGTLQFMWAHPITKVTYSWMFDANNAPQIERLTPKTFRVSFNLLRIEP